MYKKILIQFILILILILIIASTFFLYFNKNEELEITEKQIEKKIENKINKETETLIKDINYSFSDTSGNSYKLFAEFGQVDVDNSEVIFMTNVKGIIYLDNSAPIEIFSNFANYNKIDHETNFFEEVKVNHLFHKAYCENLDISFKSNIATMYNNIIYSKPGTKIKADKLDIDLITKNSKIFMNDKSKNITIINSE
tara:strand:- start:168 stop:758 length:591 start_codon:yes stop_codon:yes gene_type:complete